MSIFRDLLPIPIPEDLHINNNDRRIFVSIRHADTDKRGQICVGWAVGDEETGKPTQMLPNSNFREIFPQRWKMLYGDSDVPASLNMGLYLSTMGCVEKTGLYADVVDSFGFENGNGIMDYAMYFIKICNNVDSFSSAMGNEAVFSGKVHGEAWYSKLFSSKMNVSAIYKFQKLWEARLARKGAGKIWLCIDGAGGDDQVVAGADARPSDAISYLWAVTEEGMPVTWRVCNGGMVDADAVSRLVQSLRKSGLEVEGIILDRDFCSRDVMALIEERGYHWISRLKESTPGYRAMYRAHGGSLRFNTKYLLENRRVCGMTDKVAVFDDSHVPMTVALYHDPVGGSEEAAIFSRRVMKEVSFLRNRLNKKNGMDTGEIEISEEFRQLLSLETDESGHVDVVSDSQACQEVVESRGYYAIASSLELSAGEIAALYDLREHVAKQAMLLKSQLACRKTRTNNEKNLQNRFTVAFIASILHSEFTRAARKNGLTLDEIIHEFENQCKFHLNSKRKYVFIDDTTEHVKKYLEELGIHVSNARNLVLDADSIAQGNSTNPMRSLPDMFERRKPGPKPKNPSRDDAPRRGRGRPKGSKNRTTLEREAAAADASAGTTASPSEKRHGRRGRPKGSLNRKTLEKRAAEAAAAAEITAARQAATEGEKRLGRPKGSKNRKTRERDIERLAIALRHAQPQAERRGSGRPRGHRNMKTLREVAARLLAREEAARLVESARPEEESDS